jgi:hypothetical protein
LEPRGAAATLRPNEEDDYETPDLESDNIESMLARRTAPAPTGRKMNTFAVAEDDEDEDF